MEGREWFPARILRQQYQRTGVIHNTDFMRVPYTPADRVGRAAATPAVGISTLKWQREDTNPEELTCRDSGHALLRSTDSTTP